MIITINGNQYVFGKSKIEYLVNIDNFSGITIEGGFLRALFSQNSISVKDMDIVAEELGNPVLVWRYKFLIDPPDWYDYLCLRRKANL